MDERKLMEKMLPVIGFDTLDELDLEYNGPWTHIVYRVNNDVYHDYHYYPGDNVAGVIIKDGEEKPIFINQDGYLHHNDEYDGEKATEQLRDDLMKIRQGN